MNKKRYKVIAEATKVGEQRWAIFDTVKHCYVMREKTMGVAHGIAHVANGGRSQSSELREIGMKLRHA